MSEPKKKPTIGSKFKAMGGLSTAEMLDLSKKVENETIEAGKQKVSGIQAKENSIENTDEELLVKPAPVETVSVVLQEKPQPQQPDSVSSFSEANPALNEMATTKPSSNIMKDNQIIPNPSEFEAQHQSVPIIDDSKKSGKGEEKVESRETTAFEEYFEDFEPIEGDSTLNFAMSKAIHFQYKMLAVASQVNLQHIINNVLSNWLYENQGDIQKIMSGKIRKIGKRK